MFLEQESTTKCSCHTQRSVLFTSNDSPGDIVAGVCNRGRHHGAGNVSAEMLPHCREAAGEFFSPPSCPVPRASGSRDGAAHTGGSPL